MDFGKCGVDTSAFDLIPFNSLKPVTGRFSGRFSHESLPPSMPKLWMTVHAYITVRNIMRFRPPVVESIRLVPTAFSASMSRGHTFDPSIVYYKTEGF
jgi:hypothetical protein